MRAHFNRTHLIAAALWSTSLFWGAIASADQRPDAWVTTKTKMALLTTEGVSGTAIDIDTVNGRVTLHGKVATQAEKDKAAAIAKGIDGVTEVRNLLQVVPEAQSKPVSVADSDLKDRIEKALKADQTVAKSSISVESVNNGVVLLSGNAASLNAHLRAIEVAGRVPGVRRVASEIKSPDTIADAEIYKERPSNAGDAPHTPTDYYVTSMTKMRLLANSDTPALDINVDTRDGVVTLFGIVPTAQAKAAAEAEARKVSGAKNVRNELQIVPEQARDKVEVRDEDLMKKVDAAFDTRPPLRDADITVEVKNGVVRLTGSVPSQGDRLEAAVAARSVAGVRSVRDELRVSTPQG